MLDAVVDRAGRVPMVGVVVRAVVKGRHDHGKDMAASIAFFSFFSLFPLILGGMAGASYFFDEEVIQVRLTQFLVGVFPASVGFVRENVDALFRLRRAAGLAGLVGLLWSGSKVFGAMNRGVNRALGLSQKHALVVAPLRRFLMAVGSTLLLLLVMGASTALEIFAQLDLGFLGNRLKSVLLFGEGYVSSFAVGFMLLLALYRLVPFEKPKWSEAVSGALFAALAFQLGKILFVFYVDNVARLDAVYGSVTSIIVLLLWLYFGARVFLLGVELIAVRREDASAP